MSVLFSDSLAAPATSSSLRLRHHTPLLLLLSPEVPHEQDLPDGLQCVGTVLEALQELQVGPFDLLVVSDQVGHERMSLLAGALRRRFHRQRWAVLASVLTPQREVTFRQLGCSAICSTLADCIRLAST